MSMWSEKPLVVTTLGGQGGGGAKLTSEGDAAIRLYKELLYRFQVYNDTESNRLAEC